MMPGTKFKYYAYAGKVDKDGMFSFRTVNEQISWCEQLFTADTWEYNPNFCAIFFKEQSQVNWFKLYWD